MLNFDFKAHALAVVSLFAGTCTPPAAPSDTPDHDETAFVGDTMLAGDYAFSRLETEIEGHDGRALGLKLYVPDADGDFPVVILSHGFLLNAGLYASYGEHLASWGYVAVLVDFPKNLFSLPSHRDLKNYIINIIDWLDSAPPIFEGRANSEKLALAGHSLGGKISIYTAIEDDRVDAVFGIDAVDGSEESTFGPQPSPENPSVTPEFMDRLKVPFVSLGETLSGVGEGLFSSACAPLSQNFEQYYMHAEGPSLKIEILQAGHMSFLDNPHCGVACLVCADATVDEALIRGLTQRYLVAFLEMELRGYEGYADYLTGTHMALDIADGYVRSTSKNGFPTPVPAAQ